MPNSMKSEPEPQMRAVNPPRILSLPRKIWRCSQGAAATEFAYLSPLLLLMLLGTIEIGRAVNMDRHFGLATSTAGDLVAREEYLGTTDSNAQDNLASMMDSIKHMMRPYDASSLKLAVFQVRASPVDASDTRVEWSYSFNGHAKPSQCQTYALPSGIIDKGGSAIVVESSYVFHPLFADFVPGISGDMTWTDKSIHSPRNSCVDYVEGDNCSSLDCD
jgi:Flp pilus assembly protein TadG